MAAQPQDDKKIPESEQLAMDTILGIHNGAKTEVQQMVMDHVDTYVVSNRPGDDGTLSHKLLNIAHYSNVMDMSKLAKKIEDGLLDYYTILERANRIREAKANPKPLLPIQGTASEQELTAMVNKEHEYLNSITNVKYLFIESNPNAQTAMTAYVIKELNKQKLDFFKVIDFLHDLRYDIPGLFDKFQKKYGKQD